MRTRIFGGVEYMKATEIARLHHYAPDYIGQLCRTGKIDAKLSGRTWYATEASFKTYQNGRYGGQTATTAPVSAVLETTPKAKRETVTNAHSSAAVSAPKIAVAGKRVTGEQKGVAVPKKKPATVPKRAVKKTNPKPKKTAVIAARVDAQVLPSVPVSAPEAPPAGIKGLFKRLFGRG